MISIDIATPHEMLKKIAQKSRTLRLTLNLSQKTLSEKSGVSYGSLKKFERTGQISLESLLKLAVALGCMEGFNELFAQKPSAKAISLNELIKDDVRKRGRK